jgi:hypothetical protein
LLYNAEICWEISGLKTEASDGAEDVERLHTVTDTKFETFLSPYIDSYLLANTGTMKLKTSEKRKFCTI